jgi:divalent metal cation (Fe/Co/Zn/Cd) transporter
MAPAAPIDLDVHVHGAMLSAGRRQTLVRRTQMLAWHGLAWHAAEASVALGAGIVAGSIALVGFGADSLVEMLAGAILLWRFGGTRSESESAERRAQQLIAASFVLIAAYVGFEALRDLAGGHEPDASWVGIGLSLVTLATMPLLAGAKTRVARELHSSAGASEARQTVLCSYMAATLLAGLGANAILGWWWADPVAALGIAAFAVREARNSWRGKQCCA